jgi:hypothetical protein
MYSPKVAFVTSANGITGHAIIEHLIRKPEKEWYGPTFQFFVHLHCANNVRKGQK